MSPGVRRTLIFALLVFTAAFLASRYLTPLNRARGFLVPDEDEAARARERFAKVLTDGTGVAPGGLISQTHDRTLAIAESGDDCRGRGSFLLRPDSAMSLAVIAPHRGADLQTGTLAATLFDENDIAAAAWNSAPRHASMGCPAGDPTRYETHHLTAFSLAFADAFPAGRIVQLHGFDGAKRRSRAAQLADIIVSEGTDAPNPRLYDLADCMSRELHPWRVAVYPDDVGELGALRNRQGQSLRAIGFTGFAHIEMARDVRRTLVANRERREALARCLQTGLA